MKSIENFKEKLGYWLVTYGMDPEGRPDGNALMEDFLARCRGLEKPRVLELGTKRSIASRSTRHEGFVPHAGEYLGTDIEAGIDVDIVADLHCLTKVTGEEQFDVIISCSTFEHLKYPHLAAHEVMKALKIGGLLFIQTHQSFPLHAYPSDYFRFSREALAGLFGTRMGFHVIATDYEFPVRHFTPRDKWLMRGEAYLNVRLLGEKISATPADYIYEL
ncbi:MAG: class I SAM-dependent methyltransferase [Acidobacteriaceae bacterium]